MAIEQVSKVVVAVHQDIKDNFLHRLQRLGVLHIIRVTEGETEYWGKEEKDTLSRLLATIDVLTAIEGKKASKKIPITRKEYEAIATGYDHQSCVNEIEKLTAQKAERENRMKLISEEVTRLKPWIELSDSFVNAEAFVSVRILFGKITGREEFNSIQQAMVDKPATVVKISEEGEAIYAVLVAAKELVEEVTGLLAGQRWEYIDLKLNNRRPADIIAELIQEEHHLKEEVNEIQKKISELTEELPRLKVKADTIINARQCEEITKVAIKSESVFVIYGWVRERDFNKLQRLVEESGAAAIARIQPEPDEIPPVALTNRKIVRPFELVLELYQLPLPTEMDPTWLIAPFFGIFFALCLTDAGYGIILAVIAFLLLRKMGMNNKLLGIILIGAILTIPAGALVGGWFGDLPDRLGIIKLLGLKKGYLWFDPMKEPMKFFVLSLALGYLQLISGIAFEIADCIRIKNYGDAFLGQLPWFLLINGVALRLVFGRVFPEVVNSVLLVAVLLSAAAIVVFTRRERTTLFSQWLWFGFMGGLLVFWAGKMDWLPRYFLVAKWIVFAVFLVMVVSALVSGFHRKKRLLLPMVLGVMTAAGVVLYFLRMLPFWVPGLLGSVLYFVTPAGEKLLKKFIWGGYALYGATSYVGVLLSYIRLMALGMCSGGVAVAINVIAWMVLPIPVVGILLALIVLVVGHTYNIAVNVLGAFVHSLRLQYVEFFPRFYTGGGDPFLPFRETNQFVVMKS